MRVLNATMPVGLRVSFLPALMHCSLSQSNYRTLLELVKASPPNPLLDSFASKIKGYLDALHVQKAAAAGEAAAAGDEAVATTADL